MRADVRIALLFAGQGSEEAGMGLALAARDDRARAFLELASAETGVDVARAIERGSRALSRTEVVQPALVAVGLAVARALEARAVPIAAASGHSLGELTAACFAIDLDDARAISLAAARGRAMAAAAEASPGAMLAVRAADPGVLAPALALGVSIAAHNAPDEHVLSGPREAIAAAERAIAVPATRLAVAGPWHAPTMQPATDALARAIAGIPAVPRLPFVSATLARAADAHEIADALVSALVRPVRFVETLRAIAALGVTDLACVAPSKVMRGLARRTLGRSLTIHPLDSPADLDALCALATGQRASS